MKKRKILLASLFIFVLSLTSCQEDKEVPTDVEVGEDENLEEKEEERIREYKLEDLIDFSFYGESGSGEYDLDLSALSQLIQEESQDDMDEEEAERLAQEAISIENDDLDKLENGKTYTIGIRVDEELLLYYGIKVIDLENSRFIKDYLVEGLDEAKYGVSGDISDFVDEKSLQEMRDSDEREYYKNGARCLDIEEDSIEAYFDEMYKDYPRDDKGRIMIDAFEDNDFRFTYRSSGALEVYDDSKDYTYENESHKDIYGFIIAYYQYYDENREYEEGEMPVRAQLIPAEGYEDIFVTTSGLNIDVRLVRIPLDRVDDSNIR